MLTIVVPTIGNMRHVDHFVVLAKSSLVLEIILVCPMVKLEELKAFFCSHYGCIPTKITIIGSVVENQVAQRALGFRTVISEYACQLDDDYVVTEECLIHLFKEARENKSSLISPMFLDSHGHSNHRMKRWKIALIQLVKGGFDVTRGLEGGIVLRNIAVGIQEKSVPNSQWLPGGCVLGHIDCFLKHDYFKFEGKAHYEDVIFSRAARRNGVRLIWTNKCSVTELPASTTIIDESNESLKVFRYMVYREKLS